MASVFELSQQVSTIMENLNNGVPNVSWPSSLTRSYQLPAFLSFMHER